MTIETKYNIGEYVWAYLDEECIEGKIFHIRIYINKDDSVEGWYYIILMILRFVCQLLAFFPPKKNYLKVCSMKQEEFKTGTYLYKLFHPEDDHLPEGGKRVFIYDGRIDGDGYGVMLGFTSEEELCKSSGFGNFCYGGDVRLATDEEIELFVKQVHYYPKSIKSY